MQEAHTWTLCWEQIWDRTGGLEQHRLSFFKRWLARAKELEVDERNLREQLDEHVRHVLQGKRLLLFKEILEDLEFPDKHLFEDSVGVPTLWMDERLATVLELAKASQADL
jgi:hypothetical protein